MTFSIQTVKNLSAMPGELGPISGWEDALEEEGMATHSALTRESLGNRGAIVYGVAKSWKDRAIK